MVHVFRTKVLFGAAITSAGLIFSGMAQAQDVDLGSVARGGKLYDKWYKVVKVDPPASSHPLYPAANKKYAGDPASNWRCKECHGWDGMGADGAYATGSHASGIKGINGMAGGDPAAVVALLKDPAHGFGDKLGDQDLLDLANFVVHGQVDWSLYVADKAIKGDAVVGARIFNTACVGCHGAEGKLPTGMPPLGSLTSNPWEVMHKVLNGQPGEVMPALRAFDAQFSADVVAYIATLPDQ